MTKDELRQEIQNRLDTADHIKLAQVLILLQGGGLGDAYDENIVELIGE